MNYEQLRITFISFMSPVLAFFTPTSGFMYALLTAFAINMWAGMKSDGVINITCKNFSGKKFLNAIVELLIYVLLIHCMHRICIWMGDADAGMVIAKSLTYVFIYFYTRRCLRNLIRVYPTYIPLYVVYYIISLEFKKALPSHIADLVSRFEDSKERESLISQVKEDEIL